VEPSDEESACRIRQRRIESRVLESLDERIDGRRGDRGLLAVEFAERDAISVDPYRRQAFRQKRERSCIQPPGTRRSACGEMAADCVFFAFNMWRSSPVWGQGIGRFYEVSADFGAAELRTVTVGSGAGKENAHNSFLQILGEEGLTGLLAV
jgi:hypothetical protein